MIQSSCAGGDGLHRTGLSVGMCLYPGPSSTSTHKVVNTAKEKLAKNDMEPDQFSLIHWRGERKGMGLHQQMCRGCSADQAQHGREDRPASSWASLLGNDQYQREDTAMRWNCIKWNYTRRRHFDIVERSGLVGLEQLLRNEHQCSGERSKNARVISIDFGDAIEYPHKWENEPEPPVES